MSSHFDIVVVGGGLVGAAAAVALKLQGFDVALIDKAQPFFDENSEIWDSRIYAISPANVAWLQSLDVWQVLDAKRICSVSEMQIWGDANPSPFKLNAYQANVESLSYILESSQLHQALWSKMQQLGLEVKVGVLKALNFSSGKGNLTLNDESEISADLIVAADGSHSWVREQSGIKVIQSDYAQQAVVANFEIEHPHKNIARQWFKHDSILAFLPLAENKMSMVWSTSYDHAKELMELSNEAFESEVAKAGNDELGQLKIVTKLTVFPLKKQTVTTLIKPNLALVGDAAHLVHPLAGQGVNLGFRDVIDLVDTLVLRKAYENVGDFMVLRQYERRRKQDILAIQGITKGLNTLFAQDNAFVKYLRNWGLQQLEQHQTIKKQLIKQAIA